MTNNNTNKLISSPNFKIDIYQSIKQVWLTPLATINAFD